MPLTKPEAELASLAVAKAKECQAQAVPLTHKLIRLTGSVHGSGPPPSHPGIFSTKARESLIQGQKYLDQKPASPGRGDSGRLF